MQGHDDFAFEPIPGIPAPLPPGETLLWQGSPDWRKLASRPFRCHLVALYFAAWILLQLGIDLASGQSLANNLNSVLITAALGLLAVGILMALAYATAKATIYSITSERVLIRFGIALQITMNLPFKQIISADFARDQQGVGDIPITLADTHKVGYFVLWPHVRAFHFRHPQPMLRALPDVLSAAKLLGDALTSWHAAHPPQVNEHSVAAADTATIALQNRSPAVVLSH